MGQKNCRGKPLSRTSPLGAAGPPRAAWARACMTPGPGVNPGRSRFATQASSLRLGFPVCCLFRRVVALSVRRVDAVPAGRGEVVELPTPYSLTVSYGTGYRYDKLVSYPYGTGYQYCSRDKSTVWIISTGTVPVLYHVALAISTTARAPRVSPGRAGSGRPGKIRRTSSRVPSPDSRSPPSDPQNRGRYMYRYHRYRVGRRSSSALMPERVPGTGTVRARLINKNGNCY